MSQYLIPVGMTVIIALIASVLLTLAAKFMAVPVDETAVAIRNQLPGANCGACGFAGCDDYAAALAADPEGVKSNLCVPGADGVAAAIASGRNRAGRKRALLGRLQCHQVRDGLSGS